VPGGSTRCGDARSPGSRQRTTQRSPPTRSDRAMLTLSLLVLGNFVLAGIFSIIAILSD
jgi:hypothetical protein